MVTVDSLELQQLCCYDLYRAHILWLTHQLNSTFFPDIKITGQSPEGDDLFRILEIIPASAAGLIFRFPICDHSGVASAISEYHVFGSIGVRHMTGSLS